MKVYVGADWSATKVVCATAEEEGRVRQIRGAAPTIESVRELLERVLQRHQDATEIAVVIEAGAPVWANLFHAAGVVMYVVDPKQARKFSESLCSSGAKDDKRDCIALTELGRSPAHRPEPFVPDAPRAAQLHALSAADFEASRELVRSQQQLRALLRQYMPAVDHVLKDLSRRWVVRLLRTLPTPVHFDGWDRQRFEALLLRSGAHAKSRDAVFEAFEQTRAPWLDASTAEVVAVRVAHLLERIELTRAQLDRTTELLERTLAQFEEQPLLKSVGGLGPKLSAVLLEFGFLEPVQNRDQAGIRMGACPVFKGSGATSRGTSRGQASMRRACNPRARRATYLIGRLAQQRLCWAAAMYADGRARGQNAATVYRRITRSLLRILTSMVRTGTPYDDDRYMAALKAKGVSWAMAL